MFWTRSQLKTCYRGRDLWAFTCAGLWFTRGRGNSSLLLANFACEEKKVGLEVMRKLETEVESGQKKPTMKQVHGVFLLLPSIAMEKKGIYNKPSEKAHHGRPAQGWLNYPPSHFTQFLILLVILVILYSDVVSTAWYQYGGDGDTNEIIIFTSILHVIYSKLTV